MLNKACFSDTDLDRDNITLTDQGENGNTPNTSTGPDLLHCKCGKAKKCQGHVIMSPKYKQHLEQI